MMRPLVLVALLIGATALRLQPQQSQPQRGKIPNNLIFIMADDWEKFLDPQNKTKLISAESDTYKKLPPVLQNNVENMKSTIEKHSIAGSPPSVQLFDTQMCEDAVQEMGGLNLLAFYRSLLLETKFGHQRYAYRSDVCRLGALWKTGGYYFDVDMLANMDVREVVKPDTEFITIKSIDGNSFFTSMIGATKGHPIIKNSADNIIEQYDKSSENVGTFSLFSAFETWQKNVDKKVSNSTTQFLVEARQKPGDDRYESQPDRKEVLIKTYDGPKTPSAQGCELLVFDPSSKQIVFWSRIFNVGTRRCD